MGCRCAERMRKHVLPPLGFAYDPETACWANPAFPAPNLRSIPDAEVAAHHLRLTVELAGRYTLDQFLGWWREAEATYPDSGLDPAREYARMREVSGPRAAVEGLPLESQWAWFVQRWVLPRLRERYSADRTLESGSREELLHKLAKTTNAAGFLHWWNSRAPAALQATAEDYGRYHGWQRPAAPETDLPVG